MSFTIVPLTWRQAAAFVDKHHRHHDGPRGCKWAIGAIKDDTLHGVAMCGRPVARHLDDGLTIEINRTCTDGFRNANSALYGACWRIAAAMGYRRVVSYTQKGETGSSLTAAGFVRVRHLPARGSWRDCSGQAMKHLRDEVGTGGIERTLWERAA